jgi:hypothetical protein
MYPLNSIKLWIFPTRFAILGTFDSLIPSFAAVMGVTKGVGTRGGGVGAGVAIS